MVEMCLPFCPLALEKMFCFASHYLPLLEKFARNTMETRRACHIQKGTIMQTLLHTYQTAAAHSGKNNY